MKRNNLKYVAVAALFLLCAALSEAYSSKAWTERLNAHTATLWIEGQDLGELVLNARAELNVTWLTQALRRHLDKDRDVPEWVLANLGFYSSNRKETRQKMKGRDVFVLNYRAVKYWDFDPTQLSINGYAVVSDDILTNKAYHVLGELAPGTQGMLAVSGPSLAKHKGQKIELRYGETLVSFTVPVK